MTKRMICYRRVSTDDQADRGYSLPSQLEAIKAYAAAHNFQIAADFADDYSGATPIADRPEGKKAIAMLRNRQADGIITQHVDRLSRDLVDALATVRDLTRSGLEVHSLDVGRIDAETDIVLVIKAWQGSDERKKITERTTRGREQKARSGKVVGGGVIPYGYKYQDGQFVINEEQARTVRAIYQWYVYGDISGRLLKLIDIRKMLLEAGIKSPRVQQSRTNGEWSNATVNRILRSETYVGVWRYNKTTRRNGKRVKQAGENQITVFVPPIIDRELWEAAQAQNRLNKINSQCNCKHEYLLRGHIKCLCGRNMAGLSARYYHCSASTVLLNDFRGCKTKAIRANIVEAKVIGWIRRLIENPEKLEANLREAQRRQLEAIEPKREQVENINALITTAEKELVENLSLMHGLEENSRRYKKLKLDGDEIEARIDELEARKTALEAQIAEQVIADEDIRDIVMYSRDAAVGLDNPTFEQKRRWIEILQVQVELTSQTTAIARCILPVRPFPLVLTCQDIRAEGV
jgi:site-specific DNA recombinase